MFILNRENGTPVHGVDERPQAKADVPGEWYPATQPIPKKPGPLARVSMTRNDLVTAEDTTPAHAEACRALWDKVQFRNDGPYTPWNYRPNGGPPSLVFPGMTGGVNWGGTATDPELGYIFVNSKDEPSTGWIAPNPRYNEKTKDTEFPYVQQSGGTLSAEARDADGRSLGNLPCFRPPWASLMAVNAATGEFVWRVPLGVNDNMPEGKKNVGSPGYGGPMVTAGGLVFIGATRDRRFRAFDSRTGKELWSTRFDYNVTAIPITYMGKNGKQYVAVVAATNGQGNNESLHVFALTVRATTNRCRCSRCPPSRQALLRASHRRSEPDDNRSGNSAPLAIDECQRRTVCGDGLDGHRRARDGDNQEVGPLVAAPGMHKAIRRLFGLAGPPLPSTTRDDAANPPSVVFAVDGLEVVLVAGDEGAHTVLHAAWDDLVAHAVGVAMFRTGAVGRMV